MYDKFDSAAAKLNRFQSRPACCFWERVFSELLPVFVSGLARNSLEATLL
jgi:hypothetical protein